jgi:hypothetical protein
MSEHTTNPGLKTHSGGCHCGAVRFEVELDLGAPVSRCNCSICTKINQSGRIVKPSAFRVTQGADQLSRYDLSWAPNHRAFCKRCGIQLYGAGHIPEMGGDFVSVNVQCLDGIEPLHLTYEYWDGRHDNWMAGTRPAPWPMQA